MLSRSATEAQVLACQPTVWLTSSWNCCTGDPLCYTATTNKQVAPSEPKTESHEDLFSSLVCTISTQRIFRKRRPSGACTPTTSLWSTVSSSTFRKAELTLSHDMSVVNTCLTKWKLRISVEKTLYSVFHLMNHSANYQLNIKLQPNLTVQVDPLPSYLGICLDRSLSFMHAYTYSRRKSRHEWHLSSDWPV